MNNPKEDRTNLKRYSTKDLDIAYLTDQSDNPMREAVGREIDRRVIAKFRNQAKK